MPPLYYAPNRWPALAYLQDDDGHMTLVYHDGKQKPLWGNNAPWLFAQVAAGYYRLVETPPTLKGAKTC